MIFGKGMAENVLQKICSSNSKGLMWTGTVFPLEIHWEDGAKFEIDRILISAGRPASKAGGAESIYLPVRGREKYWQLEETRWFVEAKESDKIQNKNGWFMLKSTGMEELTMCGRHTLFIDERISGYS